LKNNKSLLSLDLTGNDIKNKKTLVEISDSLKYNHTIKDLKLELLDDLNFSLNTCDDNNNMLFNEINEESFSELDIIRRKSLFLLQSNLEWTPYLHTTLKCDPFDQSLLTFLLILKYIFNLTKIKIPKFVVYEIIKSIERKSYLFETLVRRIKVSFSYPCQHRHIRRENKFTVKTKYRS